MRLPNAEKAFVEEPKLGYLLRTEEKETFSKPSGSLPGSPSRSGMLWWGMPEGKRFLEP